MANTFVLSRPVLEYTPSFNEPTQRKPDFALLKGFHRRLCELSTQHPFPICPEDELNVHLFHICLIDYCREMLVDLFASDQNASLTNNLSTHDCFGQMVVRDYLKTSMGNFVIDWDAQTVVSRDLGKVERWLLNHSPETIKNKIACRYKAFREYRMLIWDTPDHRMTFNLYRKDLPISEGFGDLSYRSQLSGVPNNVDMVHKEYYARKDYLQRRSFFGEDYIKDR